MEIIKIIIAILMVIAIFYLVTNHYGWWTPIDDGGAYETARAVFTR